MDLLYRLTVRTSAFQALNPGAIPGRVTQRNIRKKTRNCLKNFVPLALRRNLRKLKRERS